MAWAKLSTPASHEEGSRMKEPNERAVLERLFLEHQRALTAALELARGAIDHPTSKGDVSEAQWRKMLAKHLPQRYRVCKGQIVDSRGGISEQIDVIIHDAHYCPLFLDEEGTCFVPAESVYAVFEAKQELTAAYVQAAGRKAASVRRLFRTSTTIMDRGVEKSARALPEIIGGVLALGSGWVDGLADNFKKAILALDRRERLDLGCVLRAGAFEVTADGQLVIARRDAALVSFFLRLVHRLQAIGTVPAIEWPAYINTALPLTEPTATGPAAARSD